MSLALSSLGLWGAGAALRVVGPDYGGRLQVSRAGTALAQDAAGTFQAVPADTPRFHGGTRGLLVEEARSNVVRNPRGEGAVVGGGSSELPTNWALDGTAPTTTIIGQGTEDGLPYVEIRFRGTVTFGLRFELSTQVNASAGQSYTSSFFTRLTGGSLANVVLQNNFLATNGTQDSATLVPHSGALAQQRSVHVLNYSGSVGGLANRLRVQSSGSFDFTLRLGAPQLELGVGATSPILPPVGAQGTASRAADLPSWTPSGGLGPAGTLILSASLPQAAGSTDQGLMQLDDGSDANRLTVLNVAGGTALQAVLTGAGGPLATLDGGNMMPGTAFRLGLAWDAAGIAFSVNGGPVQTAPASPPGFTRLLAGHGSASANRVANGLVAFADYRPLRLPNATLRALSAG